MFDIFDTLTKPLFWPMVAMYGVQTKIVSIYLTKFFYALYVVLSALTLQQVMSLRPVSVDDYRPAPSVYYLHCVMWIE